MANAKTVIAAIHELNRSAMKKASPAYPMVWPEQEHQPYHGPVVGTVEYGRVKHSKTLVVKISDSMKSELEEVANQNKTAVSSVVRQFLQDAIGMHHQREEDMPRWGNREKFDVMVMTHMTMEMKSGLEDHARAMGTSIAGTIRQAVAEYLSQDIPGVWDGKSRRPVVEVNEDSDPSVGGMIGKGSW